MGKDLKGKELGKGISQRADGKRNITESRRKLYGAICRPL